MAHIHGYKKLKRIDTPRAAFVGPLIDDAASARIELHASNSTHGF